MKKLVTYAITASLIATGFSCDKKVKGIRLNQEFTLEEGQTAVISEGALKVKISSVEDSRCPVNADCIWEGVAIVELNVGGSAPLRLSSSEIMNNPGPVVESDPYIYELISVTSMQGDCGNAKEKSRVTLKVSSAN